MTHALLAAHLNPVAMRHAHRHVVAKTVAELAHEGLWAPTPDGDRWSLRVGDVDYGFRAGRHSLDHWQVDPASLRCVVDGEEVEPDALRLVADLAPLVGMDDATTPVYLEEVSSTLAAHAWKVAHQRFSAHELVDASFQEVEAAMTEGHPGFVANSGRIGFGVDDHSAYAPEAGPRVALEWLAVRRTKAHLSTGADITEASLYAELLGDRVGTFEQHLRDLGEDAADFLFMACHPWQWTNKVTTTLAPDVARRDVVHVGTTEPVWQPQQSLRTFLDVEHPERPYVKTSLSIQNMGFVRGLSPKYMRGTPAINDWVAGVVADDPVLQEAGFSVLREFAAVGYSGDVYHSLGFPNGHQTLLSCLWRESPVPRLQGGERLATMASLLHRDTEGGAFVAELVAASGVGGRRWLRAYLDAYLLPVVHCLLRHDLAFMPHGENLILVLRDHVPVRVVIKDIGEEVCLMGDTPLPAEAERIRQDVPEHLKGLSLLVDVLDGFLRHLAATMHEAGVLDADTFWREVAQVVLDHRAAHPELELQAKRYDLFRPRIERSCLNRLQLRNPKQMVDLADQAQSLILEGTLANPLAPFGP
ncbi:IucA/IucC family protein [Nocardioides caldifontis]|uniref:IucA/IucC family protein n=1 Tax=Nocardioides caldifontis TaxID=2588938 RepID=UPI0011E040C3|nr:IucA/IucC family protein [Nocardioides caldifontis]